MEINCQSINFNSFLCYNCFAVSSHKEAIQVKPYYDYEEVIDSDEELDLRSMDNGSSIGSG